MIFEGKHSIGTQERGHSQVMRPSLHNLNIITNGLKCRGLGLGGLWVCKVGVLVIGMNKQISVQNIHQQSHLMLS